jgi:UTP--glucose-1-phosphate uridylyltransferase
VLRSDVYDLGKDFALDQQAEHLPFVDLDGDVYKLVGEFDKRFPEGAPSMRKATSLRVDGDWTFGHGVQVIGDVELESTSAQRVGPGAVLSDESVNGSTPGPGAKSAKPSGASAKPGGRRNG